jgi:hypothetical protein
METANTIILVGSLITALGVIFGAIFAVYRWYLNQNAKEKEQDEEIDKIKKEDALICYALSACLDGLQQLGANHTVPIAKEKLDKHLNLKAHE